MIGRMVAGLAMVTLGVLFMLGALEVLDDPGAIVGSWWPLVFVAIGLALAAQQRRFGAGPLVFVALGVALLTATTAVLDRRVVWPLVLIAVGAWLIVSPRVRDWRAGHAEGVTVRGRRVEAAAIFENRVMRSDAVPFERAALTSVFGDVDCDLREAEPGEGMTVDVTVIFGDVDISIPAGWSVDLATSSIFGDVEHRTPQEPASADAPVVRVQGFSLFGDVTVRQ